MCGCTDNAPDAICTSLTLFKKIPCFYMLFLLRNTTNLLLFLVSLLPCSHHSIHLSIHVCMLVVLYVNPTNYGSMKYSGSISRNPYYVGDAVSLPSFPFSFLCTPSSRLAAPCFHVLYLGIFGMWMDGVIELDRICVNEGSCLISNN